MATEAEPIIGNWYQDVETGAEFEVTMLDEDAGSVEIQHFDGTIEELDLDAWYTLALEPIEPPEDWTGPMDDIEPDDFGYSAEEGVEDSRPIPPVEQPSIEQPWQFPSDDEVEGDEESGD
jgi:hypothetical protein